MICGILQVYSQNWNLKRDKKGIKVYTRKLDSSKINEYKAVMLVDSKVENVLNTITDGDNLWKWNYKTPESKKLKTISNTEYIFWMKNDLPWPLKNRDNVSHINVIPLNGGGYRIDINPDRSGILPPKDNTIRIVNFKGYWLIEPVGRLVKVTQQLYGDPGGSLPSWLLNSMLVAAPYHTFLDLKRLLEN
ncbi:lipid-binding protein [Leptobacterium flavescens]|uniref:Lipid-binding protein n=2 Tax=Leptobacterium flavescens TaxID=472055 RepID=A0A6P0UPD0_9FLAO|nr:lipid-binding protein [Leptobacterium flavescens]